jgi:hypothetical protein
MVIQVVQEFEVQVGVELVELEQQVDLAQVELV